MFCCSTIRQFSVREDRKSDQVYTQLCWWGRWFLRVGPTCGTKFWYISHVDDRETWNFQGMFLQNWLSFSLSLFVLDWIISSVTWLELNSSLKKQRSISTKKPSSLPPESIKKLTGTASKQNNCASKVCFHQNWLSFSLGLYWIE
jgi:hypothetical protein